MWTKIVERLALGQEVTINPAGNSMTPRIHPKETVTIVPIDRIEVGDVVLAKVAGRHDLHLVTALDGPRVQISNNHGHVNGWTSRSKVFGRALV